MGSREDRIMNLASTLKASGLAKSEAQARMMAEEMIGVEENVQKSYEEEHTKAHEYLKTAKNLGTPRYKEQPVQEQKPKIAPIGTRIQPIPTGSSSFIESVNSENTLLKSVDESSHEKKIELEPVHTDINFGKGTLKDMMLNQIEEEHHEIKTIEQLGEEAEKRVPPATVQSTFFEEKKNEPVERKDDESVAVTKELNNEPTSVESVEAEGVYKVPPVLDRDKLREMMEEDGPMEEHTREIKEKPKDVKPKEEYVENTVDLSNMFNYNKK
jgi:hypothetical protein